MAQTDTTPQERPWLWWGIALVTILLGYADLNRFVLNDPGDIHRYHFWSLHPGGGNWAFADGSVRFLAYNIAKAQDTSSNPVMNVLEQLATRSGGESVVLPN